MKLFYSSEINTNNEDFILDNSEHTHIYKVLRKKVGDKIHFTNGKGYLFECIIKTIDSKSTKLKILKSIKRSNMAYDLHIGIAPTKKMSRFEWFVEKAIEIGVTSITPMICSYSERKSLNYSRLEKISISAMKQSLQTYLPEIKPLVEFKEYIKSNNSNQKYIAHYKNSKTEHLSGIILEKTTSNIIIGPEGGFTNEEIIFATDSNYRAVSLGNNRLRTETAGVVCCQMFLDSNK